MKGQQLSLPIAVVGSLVVSLIIGMAAYFGSINTQAEAISSVNTKAEVLQSKQDYTDERLTRIENKIDVLLRSGGIDPSSLTKN